MADDTCGLDLEAVGRLALDLGDADPFIGVPPTDLGPAERLRDRRLDLLLFRTHGPHAGRRCIGVKFLGTPRRGAGRGTSQRPGPKTCVTAGVMMRCLCVQADERAWV